MDITKESRKKRKINETTKKSKSGNSREKIEGRKQKMKISNQCKIIQYL